MANRYGRNQRRAARQRIAEVEAALAQATIERDAANYRSRAARELALEDYVEAHDLIKEAVREIGRELGRAFGPLAAPHVEKLMAAGRKPRRWPLDLSARIEHHEREVTVLRGEIPAVNYNIAVF